MSLLTLLLVFVLLMVISALPLHFAVIMLGGRSSILKVIGVNVLVGLLGGMVQLRFGLLGELFAFLVLLAVYAAIFELSFVRAFLAWALQFVVAALLAMLAVLLGASLGVALIPLW